MHKSGPKVHAESPLDNFVTLCGELFNEDDPNYTKYEEKIEFVSKKYNGDVSCSDCLKVIAYCQK